MAHIWPTFGSYQSIDQVVFFELLKQMFTIQPTSKIEIRLFRVNLQKASSFIDLGNNG